MRTAGASRPAEVERSRTRRPSVAAWRSSGRTGTSSAAALDRTSLLDQVLAAACLGPIRSFLPAEPRDAMPFAAVVPVAEDAPAYDRLLGWYGRDPRWQPEHSA